MKRKASPAPGTPMALRHYCCMTNCVVILVIITCESVNLIVDFTQI